MADGDAPEGLNIPDNPDGGGPPGPPGVGPGGGGPGGPPDPSQSPILAALSRRQQGPGVSAPGPGNNADSLVKLQNAIALMQDALQGLPAGSPSHRDVLRALNSLSRHIAQGQPTAGVQQTQLQDMLRNTMKNALLQKIAGNQGQGKPPAPTPSTPLPGA